MNRPLILFLTCTLATSALSGPIGFPAPTPSRDANPNVRQDATAGVPEKLLLTRTADTLSITTDPAAIKLETIKVGSKMFTGVENRLYVYPVGEKRPAEPRSFGYTGGGTGFAKDFTLGTSILNLKQNGIPQPGTKYIVEMEIDFFETEIPAQHMWSPRGGEKYKVLFTKTLKQIVE
jgi:hypothetical protein